MKPDQSLWDFWNEQVRRFGENTALISETREGTVSLTYHDLFERSVRAANLLSNYGIEKGDRIGVQVCDAADFLPALFGASFIGAIAVPLSTRLVAREARYILNKCQIRLMIADCSVIEQYSEHGSDEPWPVSEIIATGVQTKSISTYPSFGRLLEDQSSRLVARAGLSCTDPVEIMFTSGTTGHPKGVILSHANLINAGSYTTWQFGLRQGDRYLTMMPFVHVDFQCTQAMPTFFSGGTLISLERYSASSYWRKIVEYQATVVELMSMVLRTLLAQPPSPDDLRHRVRIAYYWLSVTRDELREFEQRFNVRLRTSYGTTETTVGLIGDASDEDARWPSIGRVGRGYQLQVRNRDGKELAAGEIGELCFHGERGITLTAGYWDEDEATARLFDSGDWLHTRDSGYCDEDGRVYYVGRFSDMIKRGGENIAPREIEAVLRSHPSIEDVAIIGVPDSVRDEAVKAVVVTVRGHVLTEQDVREFCSRHLADYKNPDIVVFVPQIERNFSGKVIRDFLIAS